MNRDSNSSIFYKSRTKVENFPHNRVKRNEVDVCTVRKGNHLKGSKRREIEEISPVATQRSAFRIMGLESLQASTSYLIRFCVHFALLCMPVDHYWENFLWSR